MSVLEVRENPGFYPVDSSTLGLSSSTISDAIRTTVRRRDGGCCILCGSDLGCNVSHLVAKSSNADHQLLWLHGRHLKLNDYLKTHPSNLIFLCGAHHIAMDRGSWCLLPTDADLDRLISWENEDMQRRQSRPPGTPDPGRRMPDQRYLSKWFSAVSLHLPSHGLAFGQWIAYPRLNHDSGQPTFQFHDRVIDLDRLHCAPYNLDGSVVNFRLRVDYFAVLVSSLHWTADGFVPYDHQIDALLEKAMRLRRLYNRAAGPVIDPRPGRGLSQASSQHAERLALTLHARGSDVTESSSSGPSGSSSFGQALASGSGTPAYRPSSPGSSSAFRGVGEADPYDSGLRSEGSSLGHRPYPASPSHHLPERTLPASGPSRARKDSFSSLSRDLRPRGPVGPASATAGVGFDRPLGFSSSSATGSTSHTRSFSNVSAGSSASTGPPPSKRVPGVPPSPRVLPQSPIYSDLGSNPITTRRQGSASGVGSASPYTPSALGSVGATPLASPLGRLGLEDPSSRSPYESSSLRLPPLSSVLGELAPSSSSGGLSGTMMPPAPAFTGTRSRTSSFSQMPPPAEPASAASRYLPASRDYSASGDTREGRGMGTAGTSRARSTSRGRTEPAQRTHRSEEDRRKPPPSSSTRYGH